MKFYDAVQMDPSILKRKIVACETLQEKNYYWLAITVRSVLIVAFAIVFISLLSGIFGVLLGAVIAWIVVGAAALVHRVRTKA